MKTSVILAGAAALLFLPLSCDKFLPESEKDPGGISVHFSNPRYSQTKSSGAELPDSASFQLIVTDSNGNEAYNGLFGDSPEVLSVKPGKYTVSARSSVFDKPKFDAPQYGDDQEVTVESGEISEVTLSCTQVNSGVRLKIASSFLESFPDGLLFVQSEDGRLSYNYRETRIAYFNPGKVSVVMSDNDKETELLSRVLEPREILTVAISATEAGKASGSRISILIDTTRQWINETYIIGGGGSQGGSSGGSSSGTNNGADVSGALDVSQAASHMGEKGVWVYGYIVGCFASATSKLTAKAPFPKDTHIAIAGRSSATDKASTIAVELKSGSEARKLLNLKDNPGNLGHKVFVRGDILETKYFGTVGIKNVSSFELQ